MAREKEPGDIPESNKQLTEINQASFPVLGAASYVERAGFTPAFPAQLKDLNDVLVRITPPQSAGFNLEITPDASLPEIEFKPHIDNPFKIEVASTKEGRATVRVSTREQLEFDGALTIAQIQEFVKNVLPGRKAWFRAEPTIKFKDLYIRSYANPTNLYEEEKNPHWQEDVRKAKTEGTEHLLEGLLQTIEVDLDIAADEQIDNLGQRIELVEVDATFYSRYSAKDKRQRRIARREKMVSYIAPQLYNRFEIRLDNTRGSTFMEMLMHSTGYKQAFASFLRLMYSGTPEEVERVIKGFTELMKKTPAYIDSTKD